MAHRTVRWCTGHGTVHSPVCATSADRWGLERLTVEVLCLLAAHDSPVAHRTVRCVLTLQFWLLTSALTLFIVHRSRLLGAVDYCSVGSPDSPVNYSRATPRKNPRATNSWVPWPGTGQCPVRQWQHQCLPLLQTCRVPQLIFFVGLMLNFMHLR
jgi:hypothetical protein